MGLLSSSKSKSSSTDARLGVTDQGIGTGLKSSNAIASDNATSWNNVKFGIKDSSTNNHHFEDNRQDNRQDNSVVTITNNSLDSDIVNNVVNQNAGMFAGLLGTTKGIFDKSIDFAADNAKRLDASLRSSNKSFVDSLSSNNRDLVSSLESANERNAENMLTVNALAMDAALDLAAESQDFSRSATQAAIATAEKASQLAVEGKEFATRNMPYVMAGLAGLAIIMIFKGKK